MLRRARMVRREARKNKMAERSDYGMAQVHESAWMEPSEGGITLYYPKKVHRRSKQIEKAYMMNNHLILFGIAIELHDGTFEFVEAKDLAEWQDKYKDKPCPHYNEMKQKEGKHETDL